MTASVTRHAWNLPKKLDKPLTVILADIHHRSCSQSVTLIPDLYIMEQSVDFAVPFCDLADGAGKLCPSMPAHGIVLAFTRVG
jgi:hypothetical protein